jgi:hypothetical protein
VGGWLGGTILSADPISWSRFFRAGSKVGLRFAKLHGSVRANSEKSLRELAYLEGLGSVEIFCSVDFDAVLRPRFPRALAGEHASTRRIQARLAATCSVVENDSEVASECVGRRSRRRARRGMHGKECAALRWCNDGASRVKGRILIFTIIPISLVIRGCGHLFDSKVITSFEL